MKILQMHATKTFKLVENAVIFMSLSPEHIKYTINNI